MRVRFEVRETILGRDRWIGFGVSLDLCGLNNCFPLCAKFDPVAIDRGITQALLSGKHVAPRDVRVVGDCNEVRTGCFRSFLEPLPQVLGIAARGGGKRSELLGHVRARTGKYNAM